MSLNCGIVGLPNVGKSTIFQALTSSQAEAANYPFCTIDPNVGIVEVRDKRLQKIARLITTEKVVPASVEIVDIAGLVKGASRGEGLGNQFLSHIRNVAAIIHVVRCFEDENIVHVDGRVCPEDDIAVINTELMIADIEVIEKKMDNLPKLIRNQNKDIANKARELSPVLAKYKKSLEIGEPTNLGDDEKAALRELYLITLKPVLYLCNVDEDALDQDNAHVEKVRKIASGQGASVIKICGKLESEIAGLEEDGERRLFLESVGLRESGLESLTRECYQILGLNTFFTAGPKEVRAWTFKTGAKAPEAAGGIHSDFERGFIKAEIYHCDDLFAHLSEAKIKEEGKLRIEGKNYTMQEGDVVHFRFNV